MVQKFCRELFLKSPMTVQNFKKFDPLVFPKITIKFQKNQIFADNSFLNTIPRPNFVTYDSNFLLYN